MIKKLIPILAFSCLMALPCWSADIEKEGRALVSQLGCRACHTLDGQGARFGPPLDGIGNRLDQETIRRKLIDPGSHEKTSIMPGYKHLPKRDLESLVRFLSSQK